MKNLIKVADFKLENLEKPIVSQKTFKDPKGKTVKFIEGPFVYKYTLPSGKTTSDSLRVFLPTLVVDKYAFQMNDDGTRDLASFRVSLGSDAGQVVENFFNIIREYSLDWIVDNASDLGNFGESIVSRESANPSFAKIIYYPKKNVAPRPPSIYFKFLFSRGVLETDIKLPVGPSGTTIPVEFLVGKNWEASPSVWVRRVYVGAKAAVHFPVEKIMVTKIIENVTSLVEDEAMRAAYEESSEQLTGISDMLSAWGAKSTTTPEELPNGKPSETSPPTASHKDDDSQDGGVGDGSESDCDASNPPAPAPVKPRFAFNKRK